MLSIGDGCKMDESLFNRSDPTAEQSYRFTSNLFFFFKQEGLLLQLRETVARHEKRIQMLEKQVSYFWPPPIFTTDFHPRAHVTICFSCHVQNDEQRKENERIWAAIRRSALRQAECDSNGNHRPDTFPREAEGRGFTNHGGRSAGAGVWEWRADFLVIRGKCFQHIWKKQQAGQTDSGGLVRWRSFTPAHNKYITVHVWQRDAAWLPCIALVRLYDTHVHARWCCNQAGFSTHSLSPWAGSNITPLHLHETIIRVLPCQC